MYTLVSCGLTGAGRPIFAENFEKVKRDGQTDQLKVTSGVEKEGNKSVRPKMRLKE